MIGPRLQFRNNTKVCTKEAATELGNAFFPRALGAVLGVAAQIASDPAGIRCPVHFMPISA